MTKFTPGPWFVAGEYKYDGGIPFIDVAADLGGRRSKAVAEVNCHIGADGDPDDFTLTPEKWANAHLIAAAPDLYEALEKIICDEKTRRKSLKAGSPAAQFCNKRLAAAHAAIAKARGQQ